MLITHGESGKSRVGDPPRGVPPSSLQGQFEQPYGPMGPPTLFTIPVLRYMKPMASPSSRSPGSVSMQREWAGKNPRANFRTRSRSTMC